MHGQNIAHGQFLGGVPFERSLTNSQCGKLADPCRSSFGVHDNVVSRLRPDAGLRPSLAAKHKRRLHDARVDGERIATGRDAVEMKAAVLAIGNAASRGFWWAGGCARFVDQRFDLMDINTKKPGQRPVPLLSRQYAILPCVECLLGPTELGCGRAFADFAFFYLCNKRIGES